MRTNNTGDGYSIVIFDNRPMYRTGIKSILQTMIPSCRISEYNFLSELPAYSPDNGVTYFFIRVGNMPNHVIIENIKKLKYSCKSCKVILYDYQQRIENIVNFFHEKIDAYMPDDFGEEELKECINSLVKNRIYLNTQITFDLLIKTPAVRSRKNFKSVGTM